VLQAQPSGCPLSSASGPLPRRTAQHATSPFRQKNPALPPGPLCPPERLQLRYLIFTIRSIKFESSALL
jgi:hypothetical protein